MSALCLRWWWLDRALPSAGACNASTSPVMERTAVEEQLGLKLVADRAPVDLLVIDRLERPTPGRPVAPNNPNDPNGNCSGSGRRLSAAAKHRVTLAPIIRVLPARAAGTKLETQVPMTDESPASVLVGDDQSDVQTALRLLLRSEGVHVDAAHSVGEIRARLKQRDYDLLLMDLNYARDTTSGREGLELLAELHHTDPLLPVVVMTGWGSIDTAVEAMRQGARGFVNKPWDNAELTAAIRREIDDGRATRRVEHAAARERQEAKDIQRSLLSSELHTINGCTMAAQCMTAKEFGGDFYDAVRVDAHRVAFWIGDVCGKGLPAALMMATLQASARAFAAMGWSPDAVASRLNANAARHSSLYRFATFFCAVHDTKARRLTFANAGHHPPIVIHPDERLERLTSGGMMLGVHPDTTYDPATIDVAAGDRIILFTDGITEAWSPDTQEFGEQRLLHVITSNRMRRDEDIVTAVFDEIAGFTTGGCQDDATVFLMRIA